jgi:hypothetical protein
VVGREHTKCIGEPRVGQPFCRRIDHQYLQ